MVADGFAQHKLSSSSKLDFRVQVAPKTGRRMANSRAFSVAGLESVGGHVLSRP